MILEPAAAGGAFIDVAGCCGDNVFASFAIARSWDSLSSRDNTLGLFVDNLKCCLTVGTIFIKSFDAEGQRGYLLLSLYANSVGWKLMPCSFTETRVILVDYANTNSLVWYVLAVLTWFSASANLSVACSKSKFNPPLAGKLWSAWATTTTHSSLSLLARSRVYSRSVCSACCSTHQLSPSALRTLKVHSQRHDPALLNFW